MVGGCHGNQLSVMGVMQYVCTEFHSNMCYHWPVIMINSYTKKHCLRLFVVIYKHVCCFLLIKYFMYKKSCSHSSYHL